MNIFRNQCPKCNQGEIFSGLMTMHKSCPQCGYLFEREAGYFVGAMFMNYMILTVATLPVLLILGYNGYILTAGFVAILQIVALSPFTVRLSRLAWIHMDHRNDPAR